MDKLYEEIPTVNTRRVIETVWLDCVSLSHNSELIAAGSGEMTVMIYEVSTFELLRNLKQHTSAVSCVRFSRDDKMIASGSADTTIILWSVSTGEMIHRLTGHTYWLTQVCFSDDDYYLWSRGGWTSKMRVFEVISTKCVSKERPPWASVCNKKGGRSTDGRLIYTLDSDTSGVSRIIIQVVELDEEDEKEVSIVKVRIYYLQFAMKGKTQLRLLF
jgi:WD40 repeat protein